MSDKRVGKDVQQLVGGDFFDKNGQPITEPIPASVTDDTIESQNMETNDSPPPIVAMADLNEGTGPAEKVHGSFGSAVRD